MFRHFQLKLGRVELGRPLPADVMAGLGTANERGAIVVPPGSFVRAERIRLYLTPVGVVRGAIFEYGSDVDFEKRVSDYASLGTPVRERVDGEDNGAEVARWTDDATAFVLRRVPNGDRCLVQGELWDRALGMPELDSDGGLT